MKGTPKLKKEVKVKEGEMKEQDATTKVASGMHVHLWTHAVIALPICYTDQIG
jgi:hypothetical protein